MDIFPAPFIKKLSFFQWPCLTPLLKIRWLNAFGLFSASSNLFYSSNLFICYFLFFHYRAVFNTVALWYNFIVGIVMPLFKTDLPFKMFAFINTYLQHTIITCFMGRWYIFSSFYFPFPFSLSLCPHLLASLSFGKLKMIYGISNVK